jgi:phosphoserine phosphatase
MAIKLLVLDLEGTIFRTNIRLPGTSISSTIWQGIANALGPDAVKEEVATHERWRKKQYRSYIHWMEDTIAIHVKYGLTVDVFDRLISSAEFNDGVLTTLAKSRPNAI